MPHLERKQIKETKHSKNYFPVSFTITHSLIIVPYRAATATTIFLSSSMATSTLSPPTISQTTTTTDHSLTSRTFTTTTKPYTSTTTTTVMSHKPPVIGKPDNCLATNDEPICAVSAWCLLQCLCISRSQSVKLS